MLKSMLSCNIQEETYLNSISIISCNIQKLNRPDNILITYHLSYHAKKEVRNLRMSLLSQKKNKWAFSPTFLNQHNFIQFNWVIQLYSVSFISPLCGKLHDFHI